MTKRLWIVVGVGALLVLGILYIVAYSPQAEEAELRAAALNSSGQDSLRFADPSLLDNSRRPISSNASAEGRGGRLGGLGSFFSGFAAVFQSFFSFGADNSGSNHDFGPGSTDAPTVGGIPPDASRFRSFFRFGVTSDTKEDSEEKDGAASFRGLFN